MDGRILSLKILVEICFSRGYIHIIKAGEIYTKGSLGGKLYEIRMKIIPSQTNASERRLKNLEGLRASHTKRPERHTAQQVSGEFPIMNITCDTLVGNGIGTCLCKEELKRDTHQEAPQLQQSKHAATLAHTPDEAALQ